MMVSLVSGLNSLVLSLVGTAFPWLLARLRQLYRVCSAMCSSRASFAMLIRLGDKSLFSMACLRTVLCHGCLLFAHLGCLGGGDNYSDSGGFD